MNGDVSAGSVCIHVYSFSPENWHDLYEGLLKRLLVEIGQLFPIVLTRVFNTRSTA